MIGPRNLLACMLFLCAGAFSPSDPSRQAGSLTRSIGEKSQASSLELWAEPEKKSGLETGLRSKLVTESIAPWRTLRLFLYGSLGSGAFIGGLINTSGAIAGSNSPDFNLNTEVSARRRPPYSSCRWISNFSWSVPPARFSF